MTTTIEDDGLPPILIYTVEDENYVVLKIDGVLVAQRLASTPAGVAILKLDAALRSSPAVDGVGEPVAWQWSDFSGKWYTVDTARMTLADQEEIARHGAVEHSGRIRPLYASPTSDSASVVEECAKVAELEWADAEALFDEHNARDTVTEAVADRISGRQAAARNIAANIRALSPRSS